MQLELAMQLKLTAMLVNLAIQRTTTLPCRTTATLITNGDSLMKVCQVQSAVGSDVQKPGLSTFALRMP